MDKKNNLKIERRFDKLETDVDELKADVSVLKADVAELKTDVAELKADVKVLKTDVAGLKADVKVLKSDVAGLKADVSFIIVKMNEYQEENRRHFQVLMEHYSSEIGTVGEGIRANRDRLDDHESRILKLEAS